MKRVYYSNSKVKKQKSDLTLAFMDSSPQVAKLAQRSEMGQKIDKMRKVAKSKHQGTDLAPMSQFQGSGPMKKGCSPRARTTMSPSAFKRRYSKDLTKDVAMRARIDSIQTNLVSKYKPSTESKDSGPSDVNLPVKRDDTHFSDPEKSESDHSDAIGELDMSDDQGRKNAPADRLAGDESGPKESEGRDAEGKVRDMVV
jgi:hypothetical protein